MSTTPTTETSDGKFGEPDNTSTASEILGNAPMDLPDVNDTTGNDTIPPGAIAHVQRVSDDAVLQVTRLSEFLTEYFPDEISLSNRQVPELPVDTAIRLLMARAAHSTQVVRCDQDYCNQPLGHTTEHGWVHSQ